MAQPLFTFTDGSKLYTIKARALVRIPVWEGNRVMDDAHVTDLERTVRDPQELQGPYSVVAYPDEREPGGTAYRVIDGQHRQEVLRRYFERTPDAAEFLVLGRRYDIPTHDAAITIFQQINHAKPILYKGSSTERLHEFVTALRRRFVAEGRGHTLNPLIRTGCNRPYLSIDTLEAALKGYQIHTREDLMPEQLVAHAEEMNAFYAEDPKGRVPTRVTETLWARAGELGFYLGLDPYCTWLIGLKPPRQM